MRVRSVLLAMLLAVLVCAAGCGRKGRVIPAGKLTRIYEEIYLADQWFRDHPDQRLRGDTTLVFDPIFRRFGYTFEDYDRTVRYYLERPEKYNKLMTDVSERLRSAGEHLQALADADRAYESKLDSFRRLYRPRDFEADSMRRPGPAVHWDNPRLHPFSLVVVPDTLPAPGDTLAAPADMLAVPAGSPAQPADSLPPRGSLGDSLKTRLQDLPRPHRDPPAGRKPVRMESMETIKK